MESNSTACVFGLIKSRGPRGAQPPPRARIHGHLHHMYIYMYIEHDRHDFHGWSFLTLIGSSRQQRIG